MPIMLSKKEQENANCSLPACLSSIHRWLRVDKNICILVHLANPEDQASKAPVVLPDSINKQYFMF